MNEKQKAYLDGASMAYKDTANFIENLIADVPYEIKTFIYLLKPIADGCRNKSVKVYEKVKRMDGVKQMKEVYVLSLDYDAGVHIESENIKVFSSEEPARTYIKNNPAASQEYKIEKFIVEE